MKIKSHMPWPLQVIAIAIVLGLGAAVAMWMYDLGRRFTNPNAAVTVAQVTELQQQVTDIAAERDRYSTTVNAAESQLNIERSAQKQMAKQLQMLEAENGKLKEDLAFFESLLPADTGPQGISIRRLIADRLAPGQIRYRLLLMQGGKAERDFIGNLQLIVTVVEGDKSAMMIFPKSDAPDGASYKLGFRHYQRVEGTLNVPAGAVVKSIQVRVLEKGQLRAQQSVNL